MRSRAGLARSGLTLALLGLALALRFAGLEWGSPRCYHPDEWIYSWNAASLLERGQLTLLSHNAYVNPTGFVYATALASAPLDAWENGGRPGGPGTLDRYRAHRADWHLVARALSALLGTLAVLLVERAGRLLEASGAARGTAVLAAALLALSPLHVRDSHFGTNDVPASCAVALTILYLLRYRAKPSPIAAGGVGAAIGAAIATKYNAGLLLVPALATISAMAIRRERESSALTRDLGAAAAALLAAFLLLSPGPAIDAAAFWKGFAFQASLARAPYSGQEPIPSWLFHARTLALALGPAGFLAALAGLVVLGARPGGAAVAGYPLAHLCVFVPMPFAFARVDVPVLPALALAGGVALAELVSRWRLFERGRRPLALLLLTIALGPPALVSVRIDHLLREPDTRTDAEAWLRERLAERPLVAFDPEAFRGCLPLGASGNADPSLPQPYMRPMDDPALVLHYALAGVRYIVLTSGDDDEPLTDGARAFMKALRERAQLRVHTDAGPANEHVPYSSEERYAPFEHVFARVRPGPPVRVYELTRDR